MATIATTDVTATITRRMLVGGTVNKGPDLTMDVWLTITVDPGTSDTYTTGGIPLDVLFTAGNANDTGLDCAMPIYEIGGGRARISDALAPATPANFYQGGPAVTDQKLILYVMVKDDGAKSDTFIEYPAEDVTTNTSVTTPIANGDKDIVYKTILRGTVRKGFSGIST